MFFCRNGAGLPLVTAPTGRPSRIDRVLIAGDAPVDHLESDQQSRHARATLLQEDVAADEIALVELADPGEVRLQDRGRVVDVVAVERHFGFEPQRVARCEPRRLNPVTARPLP